MKLHTILLFIILLLSTSSAFAEELSCEKLPVRDCWSTKGCVLDCATSDRKKCSPYHCRAAKNECESRLAQKELRLENCTALAKCSFEAPHCFCPGPMQCYCGGGPPATCREAK